MIKTVSIPVRRSGRDSVNWQLISGCVLLGLLLTVCILIPMLGIASPYHIDVKEAFLPPSGDHLLGTDNLGRDVLSRLLVGGRIDLIVATVSVLIPFFVGILLGAVSGYFGKAVDVVIMRLADIISAFPFYVLVMVLVFIMGGGIPSIVVAITIVSWVPYARLIRAETLKITSTDLVGACKLSGFGSARIIGRHILPNVVQQAITYAVSDVSANILVIVTLSYFGLGLVPPTPDWGQMLTNGQQYLADGRFSLVAYPALMIVIASLAFSLIGDGLNSRKRARNA